MAKVQLNPAIKEIRGKIGDLVFRLAHNGQLSLIASPDMTRVKWSPAQKEHRKRFKAAVAYAKAAMPDPELRSVYEQMASEKKNNKRPFDMAVSDYFQGNNLFLKRVLDRQNQQS
jgi:hypothetical protein